MSDFDRTSTDPKAAPETSREVATTGPGIAEVVARLRHELQQQPERAADGKWTAGTPASGDLLDRSKQLLQLVAPIREELADSLLADLGLTRTDATQAQLMVSRDIALCSIIEENLIAAELEAAVSRGRMPFTTARGRTATVVARLLAVMDRKVKLIQLVGLERRAKPVQTVADIMRDPANKVADGK